MAITARVDRDLCRGTGLCTVMASDLFTLDDDGLAVVRPEYAAETVPLSHLHDVADCCPTGAIRLTEEDDRP